MTGPDRASELDSPQLVRGVAGGAGIAPGGAIVGGLFNWAGREE